MTDRKKLSEEDENKIFAHVLVFGIVLGAMLACDRSARNGTKTFVDSFLHALAEKQKREQNTSAYNSGSIKYEQAPIEVNDLVALSPVAASIHSESKPIKKWHQRILARLKRIAKWLW